MSLQFVLGNSGAGKSHHVYKWLIEESIKNPKKNYIVIVPEQFTMQTQMELVERHPRGGIMNIDVLSFGRLAFRVLEEVGGLTETILDDEGKSLVLRKVAGDCEDELKVLGKNLHKPGYISEMKSILSEFTQYDITDEVIEEVTSKLGEQNYLSYKLKDIQTIYHGFSNYLEGKYITKDEILDVLSQSIKNSKMLKESVMVFDGFTGYTPIQERVLGELMKACEKVILTVTIDGREDPYILKHRYQLFALSKQTVTRLVKVAKENRILIEDAITLFSEPAYRFRQNPPISFLERELFRYSKKQYEQKQEAVSIHCANNPHEEVEFVASEILRLIRREGYQYKEIAVITNDMTTYTNCIEEVFEAYEIPIFTDQKRSILLNSFVEYIRSLLAMVEANYNKDSVFRFLRTGLVGFENAQLDKLENYCMAFGIRGRKKWQERWIRRSKGMSEDELNELNAMRIQLNDKMEKLAEILTRKSKSVREITHALYEFFVQEEIQIKLKRQEKLFEQENEQVLAKEYAQIYRIVLELFDKFVELLGEEKISLTSYMELLDAGLAEAKIGIIPPEVDQVIVGDLERTRLKEIKTLFLLGANDTILPGELGKGGFLSERDREQMDEHNMKLSPGRKEKIYDQKFYLYLQLTKPSQHIYVSYAKVTAGGKTLRPAYLVQDLRRLFPRMDIQYEETTNIQKREMTPKVGVAYLIKGLQNPYHELGDQWKELYGWYRRHKGWSERMDRILEACFYKRPEENLTQTMAESLYGKQFMQSATRLELFSECPFAHFIKYGIRLRKREEYEFSGMDYGTIIHNAIEKYSKEIKKMGYEWTEVPQKVKENLINESIDNSIIDYRNSVLYSSVRNEYMITRMKNVMGRTIWALSRQLEGGDFKPSGYEVKFQSGKIDRIDLYEDEANVYVKIVDYKTGNASFDLSELYHGLRMQLALYLNATMKMEQEKHPEKTIVPAGIFYYQIQNPIISEPKKEQSIEDMLLKKMCVDGLANSNDTVIKHLERDLEGDSLILPIRKKKSGELYTSSKVVNTEEFYTISRYVEKKAADIYNDIANGSVEVSPYEYKQKSGCMYCEYRSICGFDPKIEGYQYRNMFKEEKDKILCLMRDEV
ncbi:helicase-exonuclease AddAB subunit AddB [Lachnospiraceae bacterium OttesenSCG-928-E19]|nr:helicase-exonuclease AddAB subunit AddB [Lachnospiraceae bacterium OttesenSCG-928-E19]